MAALRNWIPSFLKPFLRFIYYKQERVKVFRERNVRKVQDERLKHYDAAARKLVLFLVAGAEYDTGTDKISGGIISIVSLCEESAKLKTVHGAEVIMCTFPGSYLLAKHTQFKNETDVFRYDQLQPYFEQAGEVLVHVAEYLGKSLRVGMEQGKFNWLRSMSQLHINILNQNIRLMPAVEELQKLKSYARTVTCTTAHQQYCTPYYRQLYRVPLHKFSVWISPEKYHYKAYTDKENLMIVSPDEHPAKEEILSKLSSIPGLHLQIIQNLTYEQYKEVISKAKWSLTFGEGLDGYLIEPIFSGAIGFAIFNEEFFTEDFKDWPTLYKSAEEMGAKIVSDITMLNTKEDFTHRQTKQFDLCARHYSQWQYFQNIEAFYKKQYTFK